MNPPTVHVSRYDLHSHTYWSYDGLADPRTHFEVASKIGVRCLAITEHHNTDSLQEILEIARGYPDIRVIPSAELTVTTSLGDVDLLCFNLPTHRSGAWGRLMEQYRVWQQETGLQICRGMQALGFDFSDDQWIELLNGYRPAHTVAVQGQTHVKNPILRQYFLSRGFINSEADYWPILQRAHKIVPRPDYPAVKEVVNVVHEVGGVIAIAHPPEYFDAADRRRMDQLRVECALDGIECAHPSIPCELTPVYRAYCEEHGLFSTGGSDSHTDEDIRNTQGRHGGRDEWLDGLLSRIGSSQCDE